MRLGVALALIAFLRLPAFRWQIISDDEAIYHSMAQLVRQGGVLYHDAVDHKPPGLVYFYATVEKFFGFGSPGAQGINAVHASGVLLALFTGVGLFLVSRRLIRRDLAWIPPALYGIVTTTKCAYDGLAVNGELLMNLPAIFGVLAVIRASSSKGFQRYALDFSAGALVSLAGLVKWQALITGLAFPFLADAFAGSDPARENSRLSSAWGLASEWNVLFLRAIFWLLGLFVPLFLISAYFYRVGIFEDAWRWGALFNLTYIADGTNPAWVMRRFLIQFGAVVLPSILFYVAGLQGIFGRVRHDGWRSAGLVIWALLALFAVSVGGRFFGHYFLQAELPLSILAAEPMYRMLSRAPGWTATAIGVPLAFFFILSLSPGLTHALFDPGEPDWAQIGRKIAAESLPTDQLFVWGNAPPLYYFSHRRMGTRFSFCNYLTGLSPATPSEYGNASASRHSVSWAWPLLLDDLDKRRPELILDTAAAGWKGYGKYQLSRYPQFASYVVSHYRLVSRIDGAVLYRRID